MYVRVGLPLSCLACEVGARRPHARASTTQRQRDPETMYLQCVLVYICTYFTYEVPATRCSVAPSSLFFFFSLPPSRSGDGAARTTTISKGGERSRNAPHILSRVGSICSARITESGGGGRETIGLRILSPQNQKRAAGQGLGGGLWANATTTRRTFCCFSSASSSSSLLLRYHHRPRACARSHVRDRSNCSRVALLSGLAPPVWTRSALLWTRFTLDSFYYSGLAPLALAPANPPACVCSAAVVGPRRRSLLKTSLTAFVWMQQHMHRESTPAKSHQSKRNTTTT